MANQLQWVVGAGLPDLLFQDFESGVQPPGWTNALGAPNYGFTPIPGYGTFSLGCARSSSDTAYGSFPHTTEIFGFFVLYLGALNTVQTDFAGLYESGTNAAKLRILINGMGAPPFNVLTVFDSTGGTQASGTTSITINTVWYVWFHYRAGTGANALCSIAYSTSLVEPTSGGGFASIATGNSIGAASSITFNGIVIGDTTRYDHVGIATFDMPTGW